MKRKQFVILGCIFFILFSANAFSAEGPYLGLQVSSVFLEDAEFLLQGAPIGSGGENEAQFDEGTGFGIAIGYDFGMLRLEGEFEYRRNPVEGIAASAPVNGIAIAANTGRVSAWSFLLNGFFDIETGTLLTPYLGGGIGLANIRWENVFYLGFPSVFDDNDTVLAYQFVGGIGIAINESWTMDIGYCYFAAVDPNIDWSFPVIFLPSSAGSTDLEYKSHNVSLGIRIAF